MYCIRNRSYNILFVIALLAFVAAINGCTDSTKASLAAYGTPGHIVCYSGTLEIFRGTFTGRMATVQQSDGWQFKDSATGNFIRVTGACIIRN